jgi:hypothetical protein
MNESQCSALAEAIGKKALFRNVRIERVRNGYIVIAMGETNVFPTSDDALAFAGEYLKQETPL